MALLSIAEAAAKAGLSRRLITKAVADGHIRAVRLTGFWIVDEQSLDEFTSRPRPVGRPLGWRKPKPAESPKRRKRRKQRKPAQKDRSDTP